MSTTTGNRRVFVNCPFDAEYLPLLQAIVFTITACRYEVQLAVQEVNGKVRLEKLVDLMRRSRLSIHDISRLPKNVTDSPRFNMPFECGIFFGLRSSGARVHRDKEFLVLDAQPYQYQKTMSDVASLDPKVHGNEPQRACECVRHFLASDHRARVQEPRLPGGAKLWGHYQSFQAALPKAAEDGGLTVEELRSFEYLLDPIDIMVEWNRSNPL